LALACRQDSGSEFHLNDKQVEKYNEATLDIDQIFKEMKSKTNAAEMTLSSF
jgi:hypothetical protein